MPRPALPTPAPGQPTTVYVDADACPRPVKELLYKVAERRQVRLVLVANQTMRVPQSEWIEFLLVPGGIDEADERIVELCVPGDLVVSSDVPLASGAIDNGAVVLTPRGVLFTNANIGERRAVRDMLQDIRNTGVDTGGPPAYSDRDRETFANAFDRWLTRRLRA